MPVFLRTRRIFLAVAWFLTGAMLVGCLIESLATAQEIAICLEENALELEVKNDVRCDERYFDFIPNLRDWHALPPPIWQGAIVLLDDQAKESRSFSHSERGPPFC